MFLTIFFKLPSYTKNFVPGQRKTLQEILTMDKDDPSLGKYKKNLLGNINENDIKENERTVYSAYNFTFLYL